MGRFRIWAILHSSKFSSFRVVGSDQMWWAWRVLAQLSNSAGLGLLLLVIPEVSFVHGT